MYLDFKEISKIPFIEILDYLGILYDKTADGIKGMINETPFVVTPSKNLFLCPHMKDWKGGIINFVAIHRGISLVEAAGEIKKVFIDQPKDPKRPIPDLKLEYHPALRMGGISQETATALEIGVCKSKSILAGKICFKMYDAKGENCVGYMFLPKGSTSWMVPKGYKHDYLFNYHRTGGPLCVVAPDPWTAAKVYSMGFAHVIGMTHESLTDAQEFLLADFDRLIFLDPSPATIVRMAHRCYVRVAGIENLEIFTGT